MPPQIEVLLSTELETAHAAGGALAVHQLRAVASPEEPDFAEGFAALDAEFGARGELERRAVLERWMQDGDGPGAPEGYFFLVARTRGGELAAVRDCHVVVDGARAAVVVYLAHALVLPAHRRGGMGALLRAAPRALGRRALTALDPGVAPPHLLLVAEMEGWDPTDEDSRARLVAYGRAGFAAIAPGELAYAQPDFRDATAIDRAGGPQPVPLLLVARIEPAPPREGRIPVALAEAAIAGLHTVFASHCAAEHLRGPRARALASLRALTDPAPLVQLPRSPDDVGALEALARTRMLAGHAASTEG
ncbi:MAG: hypothetical protein WKG00_05575 [Polyangiaceae bacterium]